MQMIQTFRAFACAAFVVATCGGAAAQATVSKSNLKLLKEVVSRYQKSAMVEMDLEKKVISELLGRERSQKAKAFVASKRFRLETAEPDKTLIVYDGTVLWNVQYPGEGTGGTVQVAKTKLDKKSQNQILLGNLLVEQGVLDKFDFLSEKKDGMYLEIMAKPKGNQIQVSDLKFVVDTKGKLIKAIEYSDELGNKTLMSFTETKFRTKKDMGKFSYKPEKGAQVTEL